MAKAVVQHTLTVQRRSVVGTRPARRIRAEGLVPGVVYGKAAEPIPVTVKARDLAILLHSKTGERTVVTLRLDGEDSWEKPVLVKDVQYDPVDSHLVHLDFQAVVLTERIRVKIPVVLKGEAVGVKQDGGILEHFLRDVEVECLPTEIPASVEFDVSAMKIGETVHVRHLVPPKHARITSDPDGVIASVQKPKEEKPEEVAAVTEPEVIREKKEEGEAAAGEEAKGDKADAKKPEAKKEAKG
ncbi:MAG: 50S ribosomal protein L25 [Candidatus Omnitrophica bacterium]|nr:50S ribosomal protein L25 [Candidatus Omnitrophota bacterium]MBI2496315.1 50S ribosomal protein L25 [Candidatus Omnitrophota bacterium]MBI3020810.1 50S ribosomal protein L25 [Candidatus Omnitrophota bacterium]MBI3083168.1 50S ribosomal protein L25 [Candidatus Omnitrophota bacterium]